MEKVLVIRKPDRTIHKVPLANKAVLMNFNLRRPQGEKWKFEEMSKEEADKLPFIDNSYITAAEAQEKVKQLEGKTSEQDKRIAELEAMLAERNSQSLNQGANGLATFNDSPVLNDSPSINELNRMNQQVNEPVNEQNPANNMEQTNEVTPPVSKASKPSKAK